MTPFRVAVGNQWGRSSCATRSARAGHRSSRRRRGPGGERLRLICRPLRLSCRGSCDGAWSLHGVGYCRQWLWSVRPCIGGPHKLCCKLLHDHGVRSPGSGFGMVVVLGPWPIFVTRRPRAFVPVRRLGTVAALATLASTRAPGVSRVPRCRGLGLAVTMASGRWRCLCCPFR